MSEKQDDCTTRTDRERPSKSELKGRMRALQRLGERLVDLPDNLFDELAISAPLREAVLLARRISSHEGRRRQLQYIGKLMRTEDTADIESALAEVDERQRNFRQHFKRIESWRDRLLDKSDSVLQELLDEHPELDRQHLRQLIRQAKLERERDKPPAAARKLFKYLRENF